VSRAAAAPTELRRGPFTLADARRVGLDYWHLRGRNWRRLGHDSYVWTGLNDDPMHRLAAARERLPLGGAFSGATAAWLHGLDVSTHGPIEATIPTTAGVSSRSGIVLRRRALTSSDVVMLRRMPAVRIEWTLAELCGRLSLTEGVVVVDGALHSRRVSLQALELWLTANTGFHGIGALRQALRFAEPDADSPMESRLRMLLVLAGLPRPRVQVPVHNRWGRFVGRPDLYYDSARLGIEYDGAGHRDSLAQDNRRQNRLLDAGVRLLRFTAADVLSDGDSVVRQVRSILGH
jgi:very-short-patch-repair endonuclease